MGQAGSRVTEDRGEGEEGRPGANELTPSPHVDQRYRSTPSMHARWTLAGCKRHHSL